MSEMPGTTEVRGLIDLIRGLHSDIALGGGLGT